MKTLHLTNAWHAASGGISTFYRALLDAAERRRQPMRLIVPGERNDCEDAGSFGRIYYVAAKPAPVNSTYRMIWPQQYLGPFSRIRSILLEERPDLVEICDKYSFPYLGHLLRIGWLRDRGFHPAVAALSCERMDENVRAYISPAAWVRRLTQVYLKWIYFPCADHHIAVSRYTAEELRAASRGHKIRRGVWLGPMGVDAETFSPARRSDQARHHLLDLFKATSGAKLLLYSGRLVPEKNLDLLFDTLQELGDLDYRLLIAGDGSLRSAFGDQANRRFPGRVVFAGHLPNRAALADLYANADVFVHPNPREPFGIAPLEAMASGLPLVAPNSGGIVTYANDENAWLTAPTGPAFAAAIRSALTDSAERTRKLAGARARAEEFEWEKITDYFLDLYAALQAGAADESALFYSTPGDYFGRELNRPIQQATD